AVLVAVAVYGIIWWAKIDVTQFSLSWEEFKSKDNLTVAGTELLLILAALLFRKNVFSFGLCFAMLIITYAFVLPQRFDGASRLFVECDFFGVKKVLYDVNDNMRKLLHGDPMHGVESLDVTLAGEPLSYYHKTGPIGDMMEMLKDRPHQHIGVVG